MRLLHAGIIYAAGNVASAAVPFALLPLLTRVLTPAEYGEVVAFALIVAFCTPFAGLCVQPAIGVAWFNRPREEMPAFVGAALSIAIATTVLTAFIAASLASLVSTTAIEITPLWAALAALAAGSNVLLQCRLVLWQSQRKPMANAMLQFATSTLNVLLSLFGVFALHWGGAGRNAGIATSGILMAICAVALLLWSADARWSLRRDHVRALFGYGVPLVPHALAGVLLGTADRWIVSGQLGPEMLGIYGAGAQLGMVMTILSDAFNKAYYPWLYERLASTRREDKYSVVGTIYIGVPAFLFAAAIVGVALYVASTVLLGERYHAAIVVLPWFMLGGAFTGMYLCVSSLFFYWHRTSLLAIATSSAAVLGVIVIWLLVSWFGIEGAAMGYAATQGLLALSAALMASRNFDLPWRAVRRSLAVWYEGLFLSGRHPVPAKGKTAE